MTTKTKIQFSNHASEKSTERKITKEDIYKTLDNPDMLFKDLSHNTLIAVKEIAGKSVVVAYERDEVIRVVTVYHTSKLDKLIRSKLRRGLWRKLR